MGPIGAHALAAFAAGGPGFVGGEFVSRSFFMGGLAPFAGDFPLALAVHRRESSVVGSCLHCDSFSMRHQNFAGRSPVIYLSLLQPGYHDSTLLHLP
jgi:hypothetical protein